MDEYDTVGVNLNKYENPLHCHYSGNFWWTTGKYFLTLDFDFLENGTGTGDPEGFLLRNRPKTKSLFSSSNNSNKNIGSHYFERYPMMYYLDGFVENDGECWG